MTFKNAIKERKYVSAQMNEPPPILEEALYAFQDPRVVRLVGEITGLRDLEPDAGLYAGGISAMPKGAYLKPHLGNSHDKDQQRYAGFGGVFPSDLVPRLAGGASEGRVNGRGQCAAHQGPAHPRVKGLSQRARLQAAA